MAEITSLEDLHKTITETVQAEYGAVSVFSTLTTRGLGQHQSAPALVWVPSRDRWGAPQKTPRGGGSTGRALATVQAGVDVQCWGSNLTETWKLVASVARALRKHLGPDPFASVVSGQWLSVEGITTQGEAYVLSLAVALDVPALPDPPPTAHVTAVALDAPSGSAGDGFIEAGETG